MMKESTHDVNSEENGLIILIRMDVHY